LQTFETTLFETTFKGSNSDPGVQEEMGKGPEDEKGLLQKMMLEMVHEPLVIVVKLADRLHNMRTAYALAPNKRRAVATETLEVWCTLAERLGMFAIKVPPPPLGGWIWLYNAPSRNAWTIFNIKVGVHKHLYSRNVPSFYLDTMHVWCTPMERRYIFANKVDTPPPLLFQAMNMEI